MSPDRQEPLCSSDLKSVLLEHTTGLGKRPKRILLELRQRELGPPSPLLSLLPLPTRGGGGGYEKLVGWEAQGSRSSVPSPHFPPFRTPVVLGYPASLLSLVTGLRPLPTSSCGKQPLGGFPQGTFPMDFKLRKLERLLCSLGPSRDKGPQRGSQDRSQLAGPWAGMTHAGSPQQHLGPMNPKGAE